MLVKVSSEPEESLVEYDGTERRHWTDLMDHAEELLTERKEELELEYKQLKTLLSGRTSQNPPLLFKLGELNV